MAVVTARYSEHPDLWSRLADLFDGVWPEYNLHGDVMANGRWSRLHETFGRYQFVLHDQDTDDILAAARSIPIVWDGTVDGLGSGLDEAIVDAFTAYDEAITPTVLCAIGIEVPPRHRRRGLAGRMLDRVRCAAGSSGFTHVVVPVRPTLKDRYPLTPIDRYARWTRDDGLAFDPWIRLHEQHGGSVVKAIPHSSRITGTVAEWESWTGMAFPDDGDYVFPGGLAPLHVDRSQDRGSYWEPNVWVVHEAEPRADVLEADT